MSTIRRLALMGFVAALVAGGGSAAADETRPPPGEAPVPAGPVTTVNYGPAFSVVGDEGANQISAITYAGDYDGADDYTYRLRAENGRIVPGSPTDNEGHGCFVQEFRPGAPFVECWPIGGRLIKRIEVSLGAGADSYLSTEPRVGAAKVDLGPGDDHVQVSGFDVVLGGDGNDFFESTNAIELESGGEGNDTMIGTDRYGDDLDGNAGDDRLVGKNGGDVLRGGPGYDVCLGGPNKVRGQVYEDKAIGCEVTKGIP